MINQENNLETNVLQLDQLQQEPTRNGFGRGLVTAGEADERIVGVCADLAESTRMHLFREKFPKRYVEVGVAEQNLATVASGMANYGKIPFITSYATFSPGRNNEQIRTTIALNNVPVKVVGSHAGVSVGPDGATHQALEDIALMRVIPNMTVVYPVDSVQAELATVAVAKSPGPVYLRLARDSSPVFTTPDTPFEIGKAYEYYRSTDPQVALVATGALTHNALLAASLLERVGIGSVVLAVPTIKPLDEALVLRVAEECGAVVSIEEHQVAAGFGSLVAEFLARTHPVPQEFVGVHDQFGQTGTTKELIEHYSMDVESIVLAVKKVVGRKVSG